MNAPLGILHQFRKGGIFGGIGQAVRSSISPLAKLGVSGIETSNTELTYFQNLFLNKTVALVGNSPILTGSGLGEEIDKHDIVIRMNSGILPEALNLYDTGQKTDILAIGTASIFLSSPVNNAIKEIERSLETILITVPDNPSNYISGISQLLLFLRFLHRSGVYYSPVELYDSLIKSLSDNTNNFSKPSTGFIVFKILEGIDTFESLSLYGFSFNTDHRILKPALNGNHNFYGEAEYIKGRIKEDNRIKLWV